MTPTEIQIAVAELCGWKPYSPGDFDPTLRWINSVHSVRTRDNLPNYPTSLDACAEFERTLTDQQRTDYVALLMTKTEWTTFASAQMRCTAFLRLHNKWKD